MMAVLGNHAKPGPAKNDKKEKFLNIRDSMIHTKTATMNFGGGVTAILDNDQLTNVSKLSCS